MTNFTAEDDSHCERRTVAGSPRSALGACPGRARPVEHAAWSRGRVSLSRAGVIRASDQSAFRMAHKASTFSTLKDQSGGIGPMGENHTRRKIL